MSFVPDREIVSENKKTKIEENKDQSWSYLRNLLPSEIRYIVQENVDYESLKSLCGVDKSWSKICRTDLGKKIMEKKFKEMVHKKFDRAWAVFNLSQKIKGFPPVVVSGPGVECVGIDKDGKVSTDIAMMWYKIPKYCIHIIKDGFTRDPEGEQIKVENIEDVINIHNNSPPSGWTEEKHICNRATYPFIGDYDLHTPSKLIIISLNSRDHNYNAIPKDDIENLKNNPMDLCAWKTPSIRKAIGKYFPKVTFEELIDTLFPDELDQARVKHSIRFR